MGTATGRLDLGVILCKHCSAIIDTIDSENVVKYYSVCQDASCSDSEQNRQESDN